VNGLDPGFRLALEKQSAFRDSKGTRGPEMRGGSKLGA
jgi:hypothetical protein